MKRATAKALISAGILLLSGGLLGGSVALLITQHKIKVLIANSKQTGEEWLVETLTRKLGLTGEQIKVVRREYEANDVDRQLARIKARPILNAPAYDAIAGIERTLTAEQSRHLQDMILDSISLNRPSCLLKITLALDLSLSERMQFDLILASHANKEETGRSTMTQTCIALFERSAAELRPVLGEKRTEMFERYIEDLKKQPAEQPGSTLPDFPANARIR